MQINVYVQPDGKFTIRWPRGAMPDKETINRLYETIREIIKHKREAAA